jgi:hypothetical protein
MISDFWPEAVGARFPLLGLGFILHATPGLKRETWATPHGCCGSDKKYFSAAR